MPKNSVVRIAISAIFALFVANLTFAKPPKDYLDIPPLSAEAKQNFVIKEPTIIKSKGKSYKIFIAESMNLTQDSQDLRNLQDSQSTQNLQDSRQDAQDSHIKAFFLLDANKHFPLLLNAVAKGANQLQEPFIIVCVGYDINLGYDIAQRTRDYTPKVKGKDFAKGGEEAEFFAFLEQNLLPYIDKLYPNISQRALFGHSFGGLFTLNVLLNHNLIFDAYFITSPSLWWGNGAFLPNQISLKKCPKILITKGALEDNRSKNDEANLWALVENIATKCPLEFRIYESQTHGSIIPIALEYAFEKFLIKQ